MIVIFIAAGSSTRLGDHTKEIPKGLLKINNKSIIQHQIDLLSSKNIDNIVIVTGPHKEKFPFENVTYVNDSEHENHDVLCSLMTAKQYMVGDVITTYSDILYDEDILQQIINSTADIGIAVDLDWKKSYVGRTEHPIEQADHVLISNNRVIKIQKNITNISKENQLGEFIGIMKLSAKGAKIFVNKFVELQNSHLGKFHNATNLSKAYLTDMLQELIESNIVVTPIFVKGKWCEIDTPQDLENAKNLF